MAMLIWYNHKTVSEAIQEKAEILYSNTVEDLDEAVICYEEDLLIDITDCLLSKYLETADEVKRFIKSMDIIVQ